MGSGRDLTPTRLPSKLPPLDVSPPSLDFSTSLAPFSSRNQASLGGGRLTSAGINLRGRSSPVKTHPNRPLITLTIPPSNVFNEVGEDVFASPRSAPTPPQLTALPEGGSPASFLSPSAPGSPLRFPVPPPQEGVTASGSFPDDIPLHGRSSEFNADFSFPRKEDSTVRNTGRNTSLDISTIRPLEKKMNLRKAHSTASKSQVSLYNCPDLELLPEGRGAKTLQPPSIPLPAPPSTFSTDTDDHVHDKPQITASTSSLIFVQTRLRSKTVSSPSSSPQRDEPKEDERVVPQPQTRKRGERRNPLTADQRDQTLLRVEASTQRLRLDELAMRFQEFTVENERERRELAARVGNLERLVEEQQQVIKRLQSLAPLRDSGRIDWERGELNPPSSCRALSIFSAHFVLCFLACFHLDITAIMAHTPDLGSSMFSPVVTFGNGSSPLKRSNTMPDGHLDWGKRQGTLETRGRRDSNDWNQFINGADLRQMDRRGGELPNSPVVREGSEATLVSSPSPSDLAPRITHEARSGNWDRDPGMLGTGEVVPDDERMKQWTPNMQEILAKLRTFESGSPSGR
jgi:hypothetical protein